jgi:NAD(P)-dependent dehydrogenase (short-subunit alcohol dehydrogenase family)
MISAETIDGMDLIGQVAVVTGAGGGLGAVPAGPWPQLARRSYVGNACVFLASSMAEWITGQDLVVDGGVSVHPSW